MIIFELFKYKVSADRYNYIIEWPNGAGWDDYWTSKVG